MIKDGIELVKDIDNVTELKSTRFRNIQDSLCGFDRSQYVWMKMGMAMIKGALPLMQQGNPGQSIENKAGEG